MPTIRDVAARAGVSTSTVSNVLNNSDNVRADLRTRVMKAIREISYHRDEMARSLRTRRSNIVGMIIPDLSDPFFPTVVRGAEDALDRQGYTLIVGSSDNDVEKERRYYSTFRGKRVDGLLIVISLEHRAPNYLLRHNLDDVPIVYVGRSHPELEGDCVMLDDIGGSYKAVSHLLQSGHRCIGIITGPLSLLDARLRLQGYKLALQEHGILAEESLIREGRYDIPSGHTGTKALLSLHPRPTALFSCNHQMTIGCVQAITETGVSPQEISLISFDDLDWFSLLRPSVSAIPQPAYELGATAAEVLVTRLTRQLTGPACRRILGAELVIRDSTRFGPCEVSDRTAPSSPKGQKDPPALPALKVKAES